MRNTFRKRSGITLIALVITIIILLILAGVAIASLTGDNGLLNRAVGAKDATEKAEILDNVRVKILGKMVEKNGQDLTEEEIKDILDDYFDATEVASINLSDDDAELTLNNGNKITIGELLKDVNIAGGGAGGKTEIKVGGTALNVGSTTGTAEALKSSYGQDTDYTSNNGNNWTWQLFYDDATNIYLIASDYVPIDTLPNELIKEKQAEGETKYIAWFATLSNTYTGTIMENTPWSNGTTSSTITGNAQTNTYLKWVNNTSLVTTTNNPNMKAVAYMMDTSKWSNFAGGATGATAIGGPTLEMFALSYNTKHSTNQLGTYGKNTADITSTNADSYGYKVKIGANSWDECVVDLDTSSDNMWIILEEEKANGYWISSPRCGGIYDRGLAICEIYRFGYMNYTTRNLGSTDLGFRPLVSIPKSSIK